MKAYCFFSVHEEAFHRIAVRLRDYGVTEISGFLWGRKQLRTISNRGVTYDPLLMFTRDLLPKCNNGRPPDVAWIERRERDLGISIERMLAAERHLLEGRTNEQLLRMAEVALREIDAMYERARPDFVFSESVSCFHSYVHYALAQERGIPFWSIGHGRLRGRIAVFCSEFQHSQRTERLYTELLERGLSEMQRVEAQSYVDHVRANRVPEVGNNIRAKIHIDRAEISRFGGAWSHYFSDRGDPTATPPLRALVHRARRIARAATVRATRMFDKPVPGEKYVLYPIHFQPEASTLVLAPMFLDQLALLRDIAKCLPIGHRLYVKEHVVNTGRWPIEFYRGIRAIPSARLLGPDENTWELIQNASAIAVITGTMGWEGVIFGKPVITFGDVYFNVLPHVYRAGAVPKDGWYDIFRRATSEHRDDHRALLALVSAMQQTTHQGSLANIIRVPQVLSDENIARVTAALAEAAGLTRINVAA